jgi:general stress protein YciG
VFAVLIQAEEVSSVARRDKGDMSVSEAGRKGGEKTASTHGHEFYEGIGKKGGQKGGEVTSEKYGTPFYQEIGHKGGQKVKELIEEGKRAEGES